MSPTSPASTVWRWALLLALAIAAVWVWKSGAAEGLTLANLKAQQAGLLEWVASHAWLAAGLFFLAYVAAFRIWISSAPSVIR